MKLLILIWHLNRQIIKSRCRNTKSSNKFKCLHKTKCRSFTKSNRCCTLWIYDSGSKQGRSFRRSIESAVKGLVYLDGDYTKVHQLMDQVPSDLNNYTSDSVKYLNSVIHDIDYHKNILEQNQIDAYAKNLQKAINNLEVKTAIQNTPDTSDHSNPWMAFMALLISGGVCISLWKRNKKHA
ncbi:LPXTG cell wall anchor domain-containing protein [Absiella sp. AM54-8XD]|uniref:LPXTG cell wall anchor domain-containing protein n=1 Tax=Absiella sp. AM54-8XD TaxID=2292279 RepID=UPI001314D9EF|nr:LPXTG cell wall anchor domain-containing protein [Absiella sp. AM54-8XD]